MRFRVWEKDAGDKIEADTKTLVDNLDTHLKTADAINCKNDREALRARQGGEKADGRELPGQPRGRTGVASTNPAAWQSEGGGFAMTDAIDITRRTMIAFPVVGAVVVAASATEDPDAELLRLGAELERLWAVEQEIAEFDRTPEVDDAFEAARDTTETVVRKIAQLDAQQLAGLRVQARACAWMDSDDYEPSGVERYEWELRQKVIAGVIALA